jgi:hypothetical protein
VFVGASRQCPSKLVEFRYLAKSDLRFDALGLERLTANFSDAVCSDDALKAAVENDWTFRAVVMTPAGIERTVYAQCVIGFERNRWGELLASIPTDARDIVTREWLCLNWSRPRPQAEQGVAASARSKLRCDTVAADKKVTLKKYERRSDVTRALDEVTRLRNPWQGGPKRP